MNEHHGKKKTFVLFLGNVVLALLGLVMALGVAEVLIRAFPNLVPSEVRVNPPVRRVKAFVDETYDLRLSDGDLYHYMRGKIVPLSPDQDRVVAHVHVVTDANGFRNSSPEKATYSIVALGDSFTRASGVAFSWPQKLAELTGMDVLNLGDVGFGPQDELKVLQEDGLKKQPQWVIMAYFGGNDLYDAASYKEANPLILFRFGKYMLDQSIEAWHKGRSAKVPAAAVSTYQYPVMVTINGTDLDTAFFSYYMGWLSVNQETIKSSQNYRLVTETILKVQELSEGAKAQFLLVYVPSKEHVYLPYLKDPNVLKRVFADVPTIERDEAGFLQFTNKRATPEPTRLHMEDHARLLSDLATENHIHFLDLTPIFQEEASRGAELYYPFDTHWNQLGHDLAAETMNRYIEEILMDPSRQISGP